MALALVVTKRPAVRSVAVSPSPSSAPSTRWTVLGLTPVSAANSRALGILEPGDHWPEAIRPHRRQYRAVVEQAARRPGRPQRSGKRCTAALADEQGGHRHGHPDSLRALDPHHDSADRGPSPHKHSRPEGSREREPQRPGYLRGGLQPRSQEMSRADIAAQAPDKTKVTFSGGKAAGTARGNGLRSGSSNTIAMKSTQ